MVATMIALRRPQPDVKLLLDTDGVIREVTLGGDVSSQSLDAWIGRPWLETVAEVGGDKVRRMVEDALASGVSAFREVTQRFPSGVELPMEYTTVRLDDDGGLIAIGKSLQAVAELQSRLIAAQQAMERDYWKLREIETRCRLLFDASNEAVLLVKASDLRIAEANPVAIRALGLTAQRPESLAGRELLAEVGAGERAPFEAMLLRVRDQGKAPGMLIHLGRDPRPWLIRASLMTSQQGLVYLLQLTPAGPAQPETGERISLEDLLERVPDGFVVMDAEGVVLRANRAFLDMVQMPAKASVVGQRIGRWLDRPGADLTVLLANVSRHGAVRLFSTTLNGELGTSSEVEIAAAGDGDEHPRYIGLLLRDVSSRLAAHDSGAHFASTPGDRLGTSSLRKLVREAVGEFERHYIEAALDLTAGNRTAAAELLGLSRQSLYAKLNRYGLDGSAPASSGGRT